MNEKTDWYGLYKEGWQNEIVPEAFSHPAKFARGLIRKIYQHALDQGWLKENDICVDPFAGVALGALDAMFHGLNWFGSELEQKFVDLGQQNIDLWNRRYGNGMLPRWGTATIIQGDSRQLVDVLKEARGIIASPPWAKSIASGGGAGRREIGLYAQWCKQHGRNPSSAAAHQVYDGYSTDPRNLGNMREGDVDAVVKGIVSSPPYAGQTIGSRDYIQRMERLCQQPIESLAPRWRREVRKYLKTKRATSYSQITTQDYGTTPGQLAAMPVAVVSSPPYYTGSLGQRSEAWFEREASGKYPKLSASLHHNGSYGSAKGQLDGMKKDTFWSAARQIVEQCYQILVPDGMAIWVVKDFVRAGKRVPFCEQWQAMCQSCGFETVEIIRAWLVEDRGAQYALNGDLVEKRVERKSFFRRLYEVKARAAEYWQSVDRDDKARHLAMAHSELWQDYRERLDDDLSEEEPPYPTRSRIISAAKMMAYKEAGEPDVEIETQIDYEVVLVMRKK